MAVAATVPMSRPRPVSITGMKGAWPIPKYASSSVDRRPTMTVSTKAMTRIPERATITGQARVMVSAT